MEKEIKKDKTEDKKGTEKYYIAGNLHYHNKAIKGFVPFVLAVDEQLPEDATEKMIFGLLERKLIITEKEFKEKQEKASKIAASKKTEIKR